MNERGGAPASQQAQTKTGLEVRLQPMPESAYEDLFAIWAEVIADGGAFPHQPPATRPQFEGVWFGDRHTVVTAHDGDVLAGAYFVTPAFPGAAAHIANAGYMVARRYRRQGLARLLVVDSLQLAADQGFDAMLYKMVFEDNPARALYRELGFDEVGRVPRALPDADAVMYWRPL